ncbi:MAG TPA: LysR family transcriptional regulator [Streptosporangiaceae bacterium]|nr:LysR family transcriptional regulator [Streptosporangiaceae bacterium]
MTRLRIFCEVASHCSFTKAAQVLGYAQPSVSHHVAQLERELGAQLFDRQPRRLQLTDAGRVFLEHARQVLGQLADAEREVNDTVRSGAGRLRLAASSSAAATLVPAAAGTFHARRPSVQLSLIEADTATAVLGVIAGDFDLGLIYDYPALGVPEDREVDREPLFSDHMAVAVPAGSPLARLREVPLGALADEEWVTPHTDTRCWDALTLACRNAGFTPQPVHQTNDYMAMQGLVATGVGVAVLPRLAVAIARRPGIALLPLAEPAIERVTFIVTRRGSYKSPAADAFGAALRGALEAASDPELPLEAYDLVHAVGAQPRVLTRGNG